MLYIKRVIDKRIQDAVPKLAREAGPVTRSMKRRVRRPTPKVSTFYATRKTNNVSVQCDCTMHAIAHGSEHNLRDQANYTTCAVRCGREEN